MNWQTESVNSNYHSPKFEEISQKKTGDTCVFHGKVSHFPRTTRHRIGICQDCHLSMREIPNHVPTHAHLCLRSHVYLSKEIVGIWSRAEPPDLHKKGQSLQQYLLRLQIWESPFGGLCLFSVVSTTPRTSVSLDRRLLESDKVFRRTAGNDFF